MAIPIYQLPWWVSSKESTCQFRSHRRCEFNPWVEKIPWRKAWQPTPVFLPGHFHGQKSLAGYSLKGHKESDVTEAHVCTQATHTNSHSHQQCTRLTFSPHPGQHLLLVVFLITVILTGVRCYLIVVCLLVKATLFSEATEVFGRFHGLFYIDNHVICKQEQFYLFFPYLCDFVFPSSCSD